MNLGAATRTITVKQRRGGHHYGCDLRGPGCGPHQSGHGLAVGERANTYSGGATINAGTLGCGNASSLGTGSATLGAASGSATATLTSGNVHDHQ